MVVTGSSKGLGNALAHAFLEAGDSVVVNSRDAARCEAAAARLTQMFPASTVRCFAADVGIAEQVAQQNHCQNQQQHQKQYQQQKQIDGSSTTATCIVNVKGMSSIRSSNAQLDAPLAVCELFGYL